MRDRPDNIIELPIYGNSRANKEDDLKKEFDYEKLIMYLKSERFQKIVQNDISIFEHLYEYDASILSKSFEKSPYISITLDNEMLEFIQYLENNPGIKEYYLHQFRAFGKSRAAIL